MIPTIQNSFIAGELSPSFLGHTDKPQYRNGASTMRNMFVRYTGGASSRAGLAYCGMCKQAAPNSGGTATTNPPKLYNFQYSINQGFVLEFGDQYMRILFKGAYVTEAAQSVTAITNANPGVITIANHGYSNGDWVFGSGLGGLAQFNSLTWIVQNATTNTFTLTDLFGNIVNTTSSPLFSSGGTFARIYTVVAPYAAIDLPYLKVVENANLMTLTCVNQLTQAVYPPYALQRVTNTNWTFTQISFNSPVSAPSGITGSVTSSTTANTWYSYEVTAVDLNGNESTPSPALDLLNNDISINAGSNTITWTSSGTGVSQYNIYAATPAFTTSPYVDPGFTGVPYGLIGSSATSGVKFIDTNIVPDFTTPPPIHANPFATNLTYPGVAQYFQQRLVYAYQLSAPDTYNMSQSGLYNNFDYGIPTVDSDAITGTPWGIQVNGIQWMIPTITGLLTFMGNGVWIINGGNSVAITPSDQNAQAQSQIGCSATVPPLFIGLHVLYVQAKNSIVRDIAFNFLYNVFTGEDITILSNHLFLGYTLSQWAYSEEPYKVVWAVRNDGKMLSLTYIKEQQIQGWARHDTNGLFTSVCSVIEPPINEDVSFSIEPPIDAVYAIVQRYIVGTPAAPAGVWAYYTERMNNRIWQNIEDCFCVDAGLFYPLTFPSGTLTPAAAEGTNNISDTKFISGGTGYTNPIATAMDSSGDGSGATFSITETNGVLNPPTILTQGVNYNAGTTSIVISDPTGTGGVIQPIITNNVLFTSSAAAFNNIQYIYISNVTANTVSVIDPITNENVATIAVGTGPEGIAVSPNGTQVWVVNGGNATISVISTISLTVIATIHVGTTPRFLAFTPDGTKVYVTDVIASGKVWPINVASRVVGTSISCGVVPKSICILPNGVTAYVTNNSGVVPITIATNAVGSTITGFSTPAYVIASPDSAHIYVVGFDKLYVVATASNTITATITTGFTGNGATITPNGNSIYLTIATAVQLISTVSNTVTATIALPGGGIPEYPAATPDGQYIYVPDGSNALNTVYIISTLTNTIVGVVNSGLGPFQVAIPSTSTANIGCVGDVIRVDGGKATISEYISSTQVMANITQELTQTVPNDPNNLPIPAVSGTWSISRPTMTVSGLNHLEGMTVTGLADGGVINPQVVTGGAIALQTPASAIVVGLPYTAQCQTMYMDTAEQVTVQGRRKDIQAITARLEASRGVQVGTNQIDASTQPNQVTVTWSNMKEDKERNNLITAGSAIPLFTGDTIPIYVPGDWATNGQLAVQQIYPLPLNLLAVIGWGSTADTPSP